MYPSLDYINNLWNFSVLKEGYYNLTFCKCELCTMTFFQRGQCEMGEKELAYGGKTRQINIHSNMPRWQNMLSDMILWNDENDLLSVVFFRKARNFNQRETSDNFPYKTFYKTSNCIYPQNCQESSKKKAWETVAASKNLRDVTTKCNVGLNEILENKRMTRWRLRQSE